MPDTRPPRNGSVTWRWVGVTTVGVLLSGVGTWIGADAIDDRRMSERLARIEQDHVHILEAIQEFQDFASAGGRFTQADGQALGQRLSELRQRVAIIEDRHERGGH